MWEAVPRSRSEDAEGKHGRKSQDRDVLLKSTLEPRGCSSPRISGKCSECLLELSMQRMGDWNIDTLTSG